MNTYRVTIKMVNGDIHYVPGTIQADSPEALIRSILADDWFGVRKDDGISCLNTTAILEISIQHEG